MRPNLEVLGIRYTYRTGARANLITAKAPEKVDPPGQWLTIAAARGGQGGGSDRSAS